MQPAATTRLYLEDDHCVAARAIVIAERGDALAFDRTCFYPGGGGQPPDEGRVELQTGGSLDVVSVQADPDGVIWHHCRPPASPHSIGEKARLSVNADLRLVLARYHTVLHVLNTIAQRDYGAWITGAQIGVDYSRIDFKWEGFTPAVCPRLEEKVNHVLAGNHSIKAWYLSEREFQQRPDLLRTLEVKPPVVDGRVRVVEIEGFDAQACGGTHVPTTIEVGRFSIFRTENKGKINKRLYVNLEQPVRTPSYTES